MRAATAAMRSSAPLPAALAERVLADQIETLFTQWRRTTTSMLLGALILTVVMQGMASPATFVGWLVAIAANQAWRYELARRYHAAKPAAATRAHWGHAWALGSAIAGGLWGAAGAALFAPGDIGHQALLIVCLFGVVLGGINLTSVYKPSLYGFVLPALAPLIARAALVGDQVHAYLAAVMLVVLAFILRFGHGLNNLMAQSLAIRYENIDLIRELREQTAAADAARASAEAANQGKTRFLAAASHDLRQPLHAMGLLAASLSSRVREPGEREIVEGINTSVEALERLLSALMDISKLDAGAITPVPAPLPLTPLFARLMRQFAPLAAAQGLRLSVVPTRTWVTSDAVLLERILANLVANAVRYTELGGVVVGLRRRGGRLWIDVVDSGVGIATLERERIFDEFYRAKPARGRAGHGMGLGLAIVRRLARLLDHPLEIVSPPGRGSRFSIAVPRATASVAAPAPRHDSPATGASMLAGMRIAVVDDEAAVIDAMRTWFAQWGAHVIGIASGDAALAALAESGGRPDLIVADYRLADGELGTEVIDRLRDELGAPIPALLVSGDVSAEAIAAIRSCDVEVLLKPVLPGELRMLVERLLVPGASHRQKVPPP
jgi:two-component system, sensor histidine kinase